ncbi:hypothetical protein C1H46_021454 [Malus baccata]|uniref:Uncharacterized protein n=1 Tax=Malus baccata TaxID=106549 RepID=A0A540M2K6_MALBA|nr:hypothetical protein C1H46_021454 [Malus baccata]
MLKKYKGKLGISEKPNIIGTPGLDLVSLGSRVHTVAVEAIEALPGHLKAAALVPDLTPFPVKRFMATLTPPIEGYLDRVKEAARKSSAKEFGS